jgi:hypothetical protein
MDRETVEEIKRHFGIVAEGLRSEIQLVAEGQSFLRDELNAKFDGLTARVDGLTTRVDGLTARVDGLTHIVQLVHSEVTGRLNDHEDRIGHLERRQP